MSGSGKEYEIGYGRPPKATRFKKGRSGNPGGRSSPRSIGIVEMIDALLLATVKIIINGQPKQVTVLEAILEQLWIKGIADDRQMKSAIAVHPNNFNSKKVFRVIPKDDPSAKVWCSATSSTRPGILSHHTKNADE